MPTQLYKNTNISFICAKNFIYAGEEYELGQEWNQAIGVGNLDTLVRARYLYPVVDDIADKPRHWHHHVWLRKDILKKLGVLKHPNAKNLVGESLYNKYRQMGLTFESAELEPQPDVSAELLKQAKARASTEEVLRQENEEGKYSDENEYIDTEGNEQTEPLPHREADEPTEDDEVKDEDGNVVIGASEDEDDEERNVEEDDLFDPTRWGLQTVKDYLDRDDITPEERQRVLDVEAANKNRKGIINHA